MTSQKVMLNMIAMGLVLCVGCSQSKPVEPVYAERQLWAVAPLRNESASMNVDGLKVADQLSRRLENVGGVDVIPVNRVISAMQVLQMQGINSPADVVRLRATLGVDALLVGTVTAYDPYDPPKLGMSVELYVDPQRKPASLDIRRLERASTESSEQAAVKANAPTSAVSVFFDAAEPKVRDQMQRYSRERGMEERDPDVWRMYRISMDLYVEFVCHQVGSQLLRAEMRRLSPLPESKDSPAQTTSSPADK